MRLVSLNIWGGQLWDELAAWLPAAGADVLLLQEVTRAPEPSPEWLTYRDAYRELRQRANLVGDISALLPGWQVAFAPAARGPLSSPDEAILRSEHGIAAFFAPHLAVTAQLHTFAHGAFRADGWGPEPVPRPVQLFRVFDPVQGSQVVAAQFHGLRDPAGKGDTPARAEQAERVADALEGFRAPGEPTILAGDFNVVPGSDTLRRFERLGLEDLIATHKVPDTRTSHYKKAVRHADYMLVSPEIRVQAFQALAQPEVSDHRALVLDCTFLSQPASYLP
ncbi:MAG: endonuclease/exonuclease/phosphatase family protein [Pseudomonadota bacterium]